MLPAESSPMRRGLKEGPPQPGDDLRHRRIFPDEEGTERALAIWTDAQHETRRIFPDEEGTERGHARVETETTNVPAESSPMRRGLKVVLRRNSFALIPPAESSPMRRGLKDEDHGEERAALDHPQNLPR